MIDCMLGILCFLLTYNIFIRFYSEHYEFFIAQLIILLTFKQSMKLILI